MSNIGTSLTCPIVTVLQAFAAFMLISFNADNLQVLNDG